MKAVEFIVCFRTDNYETVERDGETVMMLQPEKREDIIRCRDCKHWQQFLKGEDPECWANGEPFSTPPDGFCAWGERRKDE